MKETGTARHVHTESYPKAQLLRQIQVKNYKSLALAVVRLGRFTVLVGPNGAGKSNFVDALRFVADCVTSQVSLALQNRGGIFAVRRHSRGHPTHFGFRLVIDLGNQDLADFSFEIAARPRGEFEVKRERCSVRRGLSLQGQEREYSYEVEGGKFKREISGLRPRIEPDRLVLPLVSGAEEYRPVYDFLSNMRFYALSPEQIRQPQDPDAGRVLARDGRNAPAVLREIKGKQPDSYHRLCRLLSKVVPGTSEVDYASSGQKETLRFKQEVDDKVPWAFDALSMSDGTLRVLAILLAVYQPSRPSLIAIEEPEATIHPAALEVLVDILKGVANQSQILVTTYSPDILDDKDITEDEIRLVESLRGKTLITPVGAVSCDAIRKRLYSAGELLRADELRADTAQGEQLSRQLSLFGRPFR